jgi:hypothetical protein
MIRQIPLCHVLFRDPVKVVPFRRLLPGDSILGSPNRVLSGGALGGPVQGVPLGGVPFRGTQKYSSGGTIG